MCAGKFKSMGIENTLTAFVMISVSVLLAAVVFLMELTLKGTLMKPSRSRGSRKYQMEDSLSEQGKTFTTAKTRRRSSI